MGKTSQEVRERSKNKALAEPYTIDGKTRTLRDWLHDIGLTYSGYIQRRAAGYTIEESLTMPKMSGRRMVEGLDKKGKAVQTKRVYKFVRNGGGAGTWRWVEEEI